MPGRTETLTKTGFTYPGVRTDDETLAPPASYDSTIGPSTPLSYRQFYKTHPLHTISNVALNRFFMDLHLHLQGALQCDSSAGGVERRECILTTLRNMSHHQFLASYELLAKRPVRVYSNSVLFNERKRAVIFIPTERAKP